MKKCLSCNHEFDIESDVCPICGEKLVEKNSNKPFFISFSSLSENLECENGVCSFDKNKK